MAEYQFEFIASMSDVITIDADSYDEAYDMATQEAHSYYPVHPVGYRFDWDNIDLICTAEPEEE